MNLKYLMSAKSDLYFFSALTVGVNPMDSVLSTAKATIIGLMFMGLYLGGACLGSAGVYSTDSSLAPVSTLSPV